MGLLAYYKFDGNANDFGPNGINLTEGGSPTYTTGAINNGITLAYGKSLTTSLTTQFDGVTDFTFMSRLKFSTLPNTGVTNSILTMADGSDNTINFNFQNSGGNYILNFTVTNATGSLAHSYNLTSNSKTWHTDGNFHEFKYKFDYTSSGTTTLTLFVDNESITSVSTASDIKMRANPSVMTFGSTGLAFDGVMDEVRFFNHVLTSKQDNLLYNDSNKFQMTINDIDYSFGHASTFDRIIRSYTIKQNSIYQSSELFVMAQDLDKSIINNTKRLDEIKVFIDGTLEFTGLIIDLDRAGRDNYYEIYARDYWEIWSRAPITASYTNQTRSAILTDIIDNNQYIKDYNFGKTLITTTDTQITLNPGGQVASALALNFAINEGFTVYIDANKNVIFRPTEFEDTGVSFNASQSGIFKSTFFKNSEGIVNVIPVRGRTGGPSETGARSAISIIYEDDELINELGGTKVAMGEIVDSSITSEQEAINRARLEITKRNSTVQQVKMTVRRNMNLQRGKLMTLTDTDEGVTNQKFYILSATHKNKPNTTELELLYYSRTTVDQIKDIQLSASNAAKPMRDDAATTTRYKVRADDITVTPLISVATRNFSDAQYGEFDYGTKYYGELSGSWTTTVTDEAMEVTNTGIENMLRIIGQVTTVPNNLGSAYLALGTGTSIIDFSDTSLESETIRVPVNATFPRRTAEGLATFEFYVDDLDAVTGTFTNVGLFNASSSGDLFFANKFASSVSKTAGVALRFTITFALSGGVLTTAGKNLLVELIIAQSTDFLDNSNAAIEIEPGTPATFRDTMDAGFPKFASGNKLELTWQSTITTTQITDNSLASDTFTSMDLYNKTSSGTQVTDVTVSSTEIFANQNLGLQYLLKLVR